MNESLQAPEDFAQTLIRWYRSNHRRLPWREIKNAYSIWISEVMLQQTTVQAVLPYFKNWMEVFPDLSTLSKASLRNVLKAWQGLGYYQRARNLHAAAKKIQKNHKGRIPETYEELIQLPGFGPYTAAAVLSLAFDKPYPVVDANVRRVLMRLTGLKREAKTRYDKTLLRYLRPLLPHKDMGSFNQAMMELGAQICRPKNPLCLLCPIRSFCQAYTIGQQEVIPKPRQRNYKKIEAVIGIVKKNHRYLIQKRPSKGLLADLWEFPGGKILSGESPEQALRREIKEELGAVVASAKYLTSVRHAYTQFQVTLHAFECRLEQTPDMKRDSMLWVTLTGIQNYPLPSGTAKIVSFLENKKQKERTTDENKRP